MHYQNLKLDQLGKEEQKKFKARVIHQIKRENSVHGHLLRTSNNIHALERLFRTDNKKTPLVSQPPRIEKKKYSWSTKASGPLISSETL